MTLAARILASLPSWIDADDVELLVLLSQRSGGWHRVPRPNLIAYRGLADALLVVLDDESGSVSVTPAGRRAAAVLAAGTPSAASLDALLQRLRVH